MNDSALVEGLRRRDPVAVRHLMDCCLPSVWRFVYVRVRGDQHLAEDIVSEAVLALIRAVSDPEAEIGNPLGWLRTVVSNKVADHFRAAARVQHLIDQARQSMPVTDDHEAVAQQEQQERREEIRMVLDQLPEQSRAALEWKYIDKLSVREIADRLMVTEKAAESILFRGRREFRQRMQRKDNLDEAAEEQTCDACRTLNGHSATQKHFKKETEQAQKPTELETDEPVDVPVELERQRVSPQ